MMWHAMRSLAYVATLSLLAACGGEAMEDQPAEHHTVGGKAAHEVFDEPRSVALVHAACEGVVARVEALILDGANPNAVGREGVTPLIWTLSCENHQGMEALLRAGANPNTRMEEPRGGTAVIFAAGMENTALLSLLLQYGGDPDAAYEGSVDSALVAAFGVGMLGKGWENYYALLNAGADINRVHGGGAIGESAGDTIAEWAARLNQYDKVAELLDRGYNARLARLGYVLQTNVVSVMPPGQAEWAQRVREMLETRGVHFPVAWEDAGYSPRR